MRFEERVFQDSIIPIDGHEFYRCRFYDCRMVYSATDRTALERCIFTDCRWEFQGAALTMLLFLTHLYLPGDEDDQRLVELIFHEVRQGRFRYASPLRIIDPQDSRYDDVGE